jgi:hypothetical protein
VAEGRLGMVTRGPFESIEYGVLSMGMARLAGLDTAIKGGGIG